MEAAGVIRVTLGADWRTRASDRPPAYDEHGNPMEHDD